MIVFQTFYHFSFQMLQQAPFIGQAFHVDMNVRSGLFQIPHTSSVLSYSIYVIRFFILF